MAKRRLFAPLVLSALLAVPLEAATVSFLVIETGLPEEWGTSQHSGLWESGLLDVFFEAGHIVSNAPVRRLPRKPTAKFPEEAQAELAEALEGGAEYFILALLEYDAPEPGTDGAAGSPNTQKPRNISLRVFKARSHALVYEQQYADKTSTNLKDEYDSLKKAARTLIPHLND